MRLIPANFSRMPIAGPTLVCEHRVASPSSHRSRGSADTALRTTTVPDAQRYSADHLRWRRRHRKCRHEL